MALGVDREELPHIRRGALLHDVGKMLVPDNVLTKQGPLDAQERTLVRRHPEYAYDILGSIGFLRKALAIPAFHHERWDGTGYPRGLEGENIPVAARALAVADVYETLTTSRAYGPAMTSDEALSYIIDQRGSQFDPQVVDVLEKILSAVDGRARP
jgi:HD-GYP domain-containing protein (c-di-GMP phosphodiesterase class II)